MRSSEIQNVQPIARLALVGTAAAVFQLQNPKLGAPSLAAILGVPGTHRLALREFDVQLSGLVYNAGGAGTATIQLLTGTDTIIGNDAAIASTGAIAVGAAGYTPFILRTHLIFSNDGGVLNGFYEGIAGANLIARTLISSNLAGLNDNNEPVFNMVASAQLSVANAASFAVLNTFAIEA